MTPSLIDTGPSPRGFHRLEAYLTCPMRFYWKRLDSRRAEERAAAGGAPITDGWVARTPLIRGTLGHVLLAHHYARAVSVAKGKDPELFYAPTDAAAIVARRYGDLGMSLLVDAIRGYESHRRAYVVERFEVIGIERLMQTHFGPYLYTARADLVVRIRETGKVWIVDHKFVGRIADVTFSRYTLSGQFLGLHHLGAREFGKEFGGVLVNVVGCDDMKCERRAPQPAPYALARYPDTVICAEEEIAERILAEEVLTSDGRDGSIAWPMAVSEYACVTPYGKCDFTDRCRWGTANDSTASL